MPQKSIVVEETHEALLRISHDLQERVKELDCLYGISNLLEKPGISLKEIIEGTLTILPSAWQYPEVTCARMILDGSVFTTSHFKETQWRMSSAIVIDGEQRGMLDIFYMEERPKSAEGPFLVEERRLLGDIAEKMGKIIWVKQAENSLKEREERYRFLAEQVADGVALQQDGRFQFVNRTFAEMFGFEDTQSLIGKTSSEVIKKRFSLVDDNMFEALDSERHDGQAFKARCITNHQSTLWMEGHHRIIQFAGKSTILTTIRDVTERILKEVAIREEAENLRKENITLKTTLRDRYKFGNIVGKSQVMQEVYEFILKAANSSASVCIFGESGTGKELVAKAIHELGNRRHKEFVTVHCGAIPEELLESEFFGHRKGAFTGAYIDKLGYLDLAHEGTLFLDEIGEISLSMQVKLLRAVDGGDYLPVGGNRVKKSDCRIIGATNRNLTEQVKRGLIREDFFYRINVIPIILPPLRDRQEDIPLLVEHFLRRFSEGGKVTPLPGGMLESFFKYSWPGNVRELQNILHRYLTVGRLDFTGYRETALPPEKGVREVKHLRETIEDMERTSIRKALELSRWNKTKAASLLGISRRALFRKIEKYGIS